MFSWGLCPFLKNGGTLLRHIKLRHNSVDVYRYMCLTSCSAVFMLSYVIYRIVGLKERQERKSLASVMRMRWV